MDFPPGTRVTVSWYAAGERDRPRGEVVEPGTEDLARLHADGGDPEERRLVLWGGWRRWEWVRDLRADG